MNLLTVETSGQQGSLAHATISGGRPHDLKQVIWTKKAVHSEVATMMLGDLLTQEKLKNLTHIAVNVGPGSFTGIRVGLSVARTLAYALNIPILGLSSLQILAFKNSSPGEKILVAIKAIQKFYYVGSFTHDSTGVHFALPAVSLERHEIEKISFGHTKVLIEDETPNFSIHCEAQDLVQWLVKFENTVSFFLWKSVKPLYIRRSEAEEKLRQGLLKPIEQGRKTP